MNGNFNGYSLTNQEIEKILRDYSRLIKYASNQLGEYSKECEQEIRIEIFKKLSKNRKF